MKKTERERLRARKKKREKERKEKRKKGREKKKEKKICLVISCEDFGFLRLQKVSVSLIFLSFRSS